MHGRCLIRPCLPLLLCGLALSSRTSADISSFDQVPPHASAPGRTSVEVRPGAIHQYGDFVIGRGCEAFVIAASAQGAAHHASLRPEMPGTRSWSPCVRVC